MTSDRLRQLADAATPGPWRFVPDSDEFIVFCGDRGQWHVNTEGAADSELIAALGPDAARLLADAMDFIESVDHPDWMGGRHYLLKRFGWLGEESS